MEFLLSAILVASPLTFSVIYFFQTKEKKELGVDGPVICIQTYCSEVMPVP
jgi:hypothetical protein